jgi:hypothetical protein
MNERINELFEQAAKEFSAEHKYATFIVPNPLKEKFAQLIVEECAKVCDLYAMPDGTSETAIILAYAIRRKFGVE